MHHEGVLTGGFTMDPMFNGYPRTLGLAILIARLVIGLMIAAHGSQKLFGWFGGHGLGGTGQFMGQLGFRPGRTFATLAGMGEFVSGILIALGLLGPVGPALMIAVMIVAAMSVHWQNGLFATQNGIELPLLYATGAIGLALAGNGPYSLDAAFGIRREWTPRVVWIVLIVGVLGGLANLALRGRRARVDV